MELLKINDPLERGFYQQQAIAERWSVRELQRQKETSLLSPSGGRARAEHAILQMAAQGQVIAPLEDLLRDPYVFDFLKIPEPYLPSENQLETLLCDQLQSFLLELGKGFTFVGRQYRTTMNNTHFRVDLVFYHRILRRFVPSSLRKSRTLPISAIRHGVSLTASYFCQRGERRRLTTRLVGLILTRNKDELLVEYATYQMNRQLFVQEYQLYLPDREELRRQLELTLKEAKEAQGHLAGRKNETNIPR